MKTKRTTTQNTNKFLFLLTSWGEGGGEVKGGFSSERRACSGNF